MKALVAMLLLVVLVCSGCEKPGSAAASGKIPAGSSCTIQFKRDMLGISRELPISLMTGSMNGAEVSLSGKLIRMDDWMTNGS